MKPVITEFDLADYLDSEETIAEYISQVLSEGDTDELIRAIGHVAKARGMAQIAKSSGLGRESLYKALAPGAKPRFETVVKVIRALGVELSAKPVSVEYPVSLRGLAAELKAEEAELAGATIAAPRDTHAKPAHAKDKPAKTEHA